MTGPIDNPIGGSIPTSLFRGPGSSLEKEPGLVEWERQGRVQDSSDLLVYLVSSDPESGPGVRTQDGGQGPGLQDSGEPSLGPSLLPCHDPHGYRRSVPPTSLGLGSRTQGETLQRTLGGPGALGVPTESLGGTRTGTTEVGRERGSRGKETLPRGRFSRLLTPAPVSATPVPTLRSGDSGGLESDLCPVASPTPTPAPSPA